MPVTRITRIRKAPSLVEQVCLQLATLLREGNGPADGKLMAERGLAEQLGVSRNVLREATKRLEIQGLVEIRQGHGTRVVNNLHKPLTAALNLLVPEEVERMQQLFEVRLILEPQAARLAARRSSKALLLKMEAAQDALRDAASIEVSVAADMQFHRAIAEASGNKILLLVIESLSELLADTHLKGYRSEPVPSPIWRHQDILSAIQRGDGDGAAAAMSTHIRDARTILNLPDNADLD